MRPGERVVGSGGRGKDGEVKEVDFKSTSDSRERENGRIESILAQVSEVMFNHQIFLTHPSCFFFSSLDLFFFRSKRANRRLHSEETASAFFVGAIIVI